MLRTQASELRYRSDIHLEFGQQIDLSTVFSCETLFSSLKLTNSVQMKTSCKDLQLVTNVVNSSTEHSGQTTGSIITVTPLKVINLHTCLFCFVVNN